MLYYPRTTPNTTAAASPTTGIRAGAHSDYGSLTLLFRRPGEPGLELHTSSRGWVPVPVNPAPASLAHPPVLVNIGDLLSFWTAGLLKSTVHRVSFEGGEERYSMAYFCHPLDEARLERVPGRVLDAFGEKGREELDAQRRRLGLVDGEGDVLTAKEHLDRRLKVTYGL
jgi:isopenicillin N synthase-like dioxygenase